MRLTRRFPKTSFSSSSMTVCVIAPMARNMMLTPKKMRNELNTRPAWLSG